MDTIVSYYECHFRDEKAKATAHSKLFRFISAVANTAGGAEQGDGTRARSGFENVEAANGPLRDVALPANLIPMHVSGYLIDGSAPCQGEISLRLLESDWTTGQKSTTLLA